MINVLVAEDNPVNRELLRELLEVQGFNVIEAGDGQEALRMIEVNHPQILLLDIGMPILDGFEVMRKIRENPRFATLRVLAVTAYAMQGDRENILNAGFDGYLSKPINARFLYNELERLVRAQEDHFADSKPSPVPTQKDEAASRSIAHNTSRRL